MAHKPNRSLHTRARGAIKDRGTRPCRLIWKYCSPARGFLALRTPLNLLEANEPMVLSLFKGRRKSQGRPLDLPFALRFFHDQVAAASVPLPLDNIFGQSISSTTSRAARFVET